MTFVYTVFTQAGCEKYERLAKVLDVSIRRNCPSAKIIRIDTAPPPLIPGKPRGHVDNTKKLEIWSEQVQKIDDDIILIDCDMVICRDIQLVFEDDFDVGIMQRTSKHKIPYNGGLVFVKNTPFGKAFVHRWNENNKLFFSDNAAYNSYRSKTIGINQAALLATIDQVAGAMSIKFFPCRRWDACLEDWPFVNDQTIAIHVMGDLRMAALRGNNPDSAPATYAPALRLWSEYAKLVRSE